MPAESLAVTPPLGFPIPNTSWRSRRRPSPPGFATATNSSSAMRPFAFGGRAGAASRQASGISAQSDGSLLDLREDRSHRHCSDPGRGRIASLQSPERSGYAEGRAAPAGDAQRRTGSPYLDACEGARIAILPMPKPAPDQALAKVRGTLMPQTGMHDLCLIFTRAAPDPYWALHTVQLLPVR